MRPARLLLKMPIKTVADRRARRAIPIVPSGETEFTVAEQEIFVALERRVATRLPRK
jgi:hypothetical protein